MTSLTHAKAGLLLGPDGRIVDVDAEVLAWIGRPAAWAKGRTLEDLFEITDSIPVGQAYSLKTAGGGRMPVTASVLPTKGGIRLELSPGQVDDLPHRHARLVKAQDLARLGVWEVRPATDKLFCSDGLLHILGIDRPPKAAGAEFFERFVHEDDKAELHEAAAKSKASGEPLDVVVRIIRADGQERSLHVQAIDDKGPDGQVEVSYGVAQDITKARAAEVHFQAMLEGAPDPIVLADASGTIQFVNDALTRVLGYEPEDLIGSPVEVLVPEGLRHRHEAHRAGFMDHPEARPMGQGFDLKALHKDGHEVTVEISLSPLKTPNGMVVMAALRDTTQRRLAEEADRLAFERLIEIQQLREVDRAKTAVLNIASHELKTPLTPLRLQLYLLGSEQLGLIDEKQRHAVDVLKRNTERLSILIADVLDMARIESGHIALNIVEVPASKVIDEAVEPFEEAVAQAGLNLAHEVDDLVVAVDADRLVQVIINFVSNAIKFSKPGQTITLGARRDGDRIRLFVKDEGAGIDPTKQPKLFQPFSQVHEAGSIEERGTGLGLYICKGIIEKHGGEIGVDSDGEGRGSTFWCSLPAGGAP